MFYHNLKKKRKQMKILELISTESEAEKSLDGLQIINCIRKTTELEDRSTEKHPIQTP